MQKKPAVSIIMITEHTYEACRRTISYLLAQSVVDQIEFVLVGPSRAVMQVDEAELAPFHSVKIIEIGDEVSTGLGLAAGTVSCGADLVTYAEEHAFPPTNLIETMLRVAGETDYEAYGWSIVPSNPGVVAWAHIYGQFAEVVAPRASGEVLRLGGHQTLYRRALLMDYRDDLVDLYGCEAVFHEVLESRGIKRFVVGEVANGHAQISDFRQYLRHEFVAQRAFAVARLRQLGWGWGRRLVYVAGAPLIPFLRLWRTLPYIKATGRWRQLMPQVGLIMFAANCAGALGEALGYLTASSGVASSERSKIELNRFSYVAEADRAQRHRRSPAAQQPSGKDNLS